jgi:hypothetical protein
MRRRLTYLAAGLGLLSGVLVPMTAWAAHNDDYGRHHHCWSHHHRLYCYPMMGDGYYNHHHMMYGDHMMYGGRYHHMMMGDDRY